MAAHQAPLSLGFSRQEHWNGLPFPSPMHESEKWKVKLLSHVRLLATPWTAAHQAPKPMGFFRQEYWSGVQLLSPVCCLVYFKSSPASGMSKQCKSQEKTIQEVPWLHKAHQQLYHSLHSKSGWSVDLEIWVTLYQGSLILINFQPISEIRLIIFYYFHNLVKCSRKKFFFNSHI